MNARLIKFWYDLQSSYYFIPGLMALSAIILAAFTSHLDNTLGYDGAEKLGWFYTNKPEGARAVLTTIAASMMTVAAVTFSITMVAVTSAAGQYGPRLVGNFMRDRANQFTLGTFTSTFVYCLLILRVTRTGDATGYAPNISLLVAMGLTLASVAVMIFFIHHIPETLNVGNITGKVGRDLRNDIEKLFQETDLKNDENYDDPELSEFSDADSFKIKSKTEGYIQTINEKQLLVLAKENDWIIRIRLRQGQFATRGDVLLSIWSEQPLKDEAYEKLHNTYAMGTKRTGNQDILFLVDELVEILARALSPGTNDPFTAINCINWFNSAIKAYMNIEVPSAFRRDNEGNILVIAEPLSFENFLSKICDQSRPYIVSDRNAALSMLHMLDKVAKQASTTAYHAAITEQFLKLRKAASQNLPHEVDRREISNLSIN